MSLARDMELGGVEPPGSREGLGHLEDVFLLLMDRKVCVASFQLHPELCPLLGWEPLWERLRASGEEIDPEGAEGSGTHFVALNRCPAVGGL